MRKTQFNSKALYLSYIGLLDSYGLVVKIKQKWTISQDKGINTQYEKKPYEKKPYVYNHTLLLNTNNDRIWWHSLQCTTKKCNLTIYDRFKNGTCLLISIIYNTHTHGCSRTCAHTNTHVYIHKYTHTHTLTHTRSHTHACTRTHTHSHSHTHTDTHALYQSINQSIKCRRNYIKLCS